jgi:hypothetical protein
MSDRLQQASQSAPSGRRHQAIALVLSMLMSMSWPEAPAMAQNWGAIGAGAGVALGILGALNSQRRGRYARAAPRARHATTHVARARAEPVHARHASSKSSRRRSGGEAEEIQAASPRSGGAAPTLLPAAPAAAAIVAPVGVAAAMSATPAEPAGPTGGSFH